MQAKTGKTSPMESDGAFMLGNEQDCYGGCTDSTQAFYGLMDEVTALQKLCRPDAVDTYQAGKRISYFSSITQVISCKSRMDPGPIVQ